MTSAPSPITDNAYDYWASSRPNGVRWMASATRFCRRKPLGAFGGFILFVFVAAAVFGPLLSPYPANENSEDILVGPRLSHPFGTDQFGRDIFSRILEGARVSLLVGVGATLASTLGAVVLGLASGYFRGPVDYFVQRFVDAMQAIPPLIMLITLLVVLGPSIMNVIIALSVRGAFVSSRVIRGAVLGLLGNAYVEVARSVGCTDLRIMVRHLLPNVMPIVLVSVSVSVGANILAESSLSFLGYGVPPPAPTWGGMVSGEGRAFMLIAPWLLIAPATVLSAVVFASNMLGDALRDELDPRLRGTGESASLRPT